MRQRDIVEKERLLEHAEMAMRRLQIRPVVIEMDITTAVGMIGALQLALRHPGFRNRPTARAVRGTLDQLIDALSEGDAEFREFLKLGNNPAFDV